VILDIGEIVAGRGLTTLFSGSAKRAGRKSKTKKFLKYYGPEYVEKFEKEKRKK